MKKQVCFECGNNPAPHILLLCAQSIVFVSGVLARQSHQRAFAETLRSFAQRIVGLAGVSRWKTEPAHYASDRSKVVAVAAKKRGIKLEQEYLFGAPTDTFRYTFRDTKREFFSLPTGLHDDSFTRKRLDNKWSTKHILQNLHTNTPKGMLVWRARQLKDVTRKLKYPLTVKPAQGSRGRHTTILVQDEAQLRAAYKTAHKICMFVIVEQHLDGMVYRFTTVGGRLAAVLRGEYPTVIGDGTSTLRELIMRKDATRPEGVQPAKIDHSLILRQGYQEKSVPKKHKQILLGSKIGVRYGGDAVEITTDVHESFRSEIDRIARKIPLFILGFDIIAEDPTKPATTQKWGIIEINTIPFIDLHHYPRVGTPVDVAGLTWDELLKR